MTQITAKQKELTARRTELALKVDIEDMAQYALDWNILGADFEAAGWHNNAEICFSNAARYGAMEPGEYERLLEESSPIVRLVKVDGVDMAERIPQWTDPNERMLPCGVCGTWTKHVALHEAITGPVVGWMCGCGTLTEVKSVDEAVR